MKNKKINKLSLMLATVAMFSVAGSKQAVFASAHHENDQSDNLGGGSISFIFKNRMHGCIGGMRCFDEECLEQQIKTAKESGNSESEFVGFKAIEMNNDSVISDSMYDPYLGEGDVLLNTVEDIRNSGGTVFCPVYMKKNVFLHVSNEETLEFVKFNGEIINCKYEDVIKKVKVPEGYVFVGFKPGKSYGSSNLYDSSDVLQLDEIINSQEREFSPVFKLEEPKSVTNTVIKSTKTPILVIFHTNCEEIQYEYGYVDSRIIRETKIYSSGKECNVDVFSTEIKENDNQAWRGLLGKVSDDQQVPERQVFVGWKDKRDIRVYDKEGNNGGISGFLEECCTNKEDKIYVLDLYPLFQGERFEVKSNEEKTLPECFECPQGYELYGWKFVGSDVKEIEVTNKSGMKFKTKKGSICATGSKVYNEGKGTVEFEPVILESNDPYMLAKKGIDVNQEEIKINRMQVIQYEEPGCDECECIEELECKEEKISKPQILDYISNRKVLVKYCVKNDRWHTSYKGEVYNKEMSNNIFLDCFKGENKKVVAWSLYPDARLEDQNNMNFEEKIDIQNIDINLLKIDGKGNLIIKLYPVLSNK